MSQVSHVPWLFQVERGGPARTHFPDIYREFESLQAQVRQAAQDYISSPQGGATPLEVRNIEVSHVLRLEHLSQVECGIQVTQTLMCFRWPGLWESWMR